MAIDPMSQERQKRWRYGIFAAVLGILIVIGLAEIFTNTSNVDISVKTVHISIAEDPLQIQNGFEVATKSPWDLLGKLGKVHNCESLFFAAKNADAVDINQSLSDVLLKGGPQDGVTVVGLRPQVVKREPSLDGAKASCASAGVVEGVGVAFNFDEVQPIARHANNGPSNGLPYFKHGKVITLKEEEVHPLEIIATSSRSYVEWNLVVNLVVNGVHGTVILNNHGQPFRITGGSPTGEYARYYEWLWYKIPPSFYAANRPVS